MFLHLSVSHSVHGGSTWAGTPPGRYIPPGRYPPEGTPPVQVHPPPEAVQTGRYEQQAGGTHPTGMHSCFSFKSKDGAYLENHHKYMITTSAECRKRQRQQTCGLFTNDPYFWLM